MQNTSINPVCLIQNPLKVIKLCGKVNKDNQTLKTELVKAYLDLFQGNWIISLDSFCFKVNSPSQLETVYEISTSLCPGVFFNAETKRPSSDLTIIGHIYAVSPKDLFFFGNFQRTWFSIDFPSTQLEIFCKHLDMTKQENADIDLALTVLFQRQL